EHNASDRGRPGKTTYRPTALGDKPISEQSSHGEAGESGPRLSKVEADREEREKPDSHRPGEPGVAPPGEHDDEKGDADLGASPKWVPSGPGEAGDLALRRCLRRPAALEDQSEDAQ